MVFVHLTLSSATGMHVCAQSLAGTHTFYVPVLPKPCMQVVKGLMDAPNTLNPQKKTPRTSLPAYCAARLLNKGGVAALSVNSSTHAPQAAAPLATPLAPAALPPQRASSASSCAGLLNAVTCTSTELCRRAGRMNLSLGSRSVKKRIAYQDQEAIHRVLLCGTALFHMIVGYNSERSLAHPLAHVEHLSTRTPFCCLAGCQATLH